MSIPCVGYDLFFRAVSSQVFSALQSLTSVFGMGTGVPFAFVTLTILASFDACVGIDLSSRAVSSQVLSALVSLTAVFGMGTGGPSPLKTPTMGFCTLKTEQMEFNRSKALPAYFIVGQALGLLVSVS